MSDLRKNFAELMELYESIKQEIRRRDKVLFEQWKAGGFQIDENILNFYPHLSQVMEALPPDEDDEEEDDSEDDEEDLNRGYLYHPLNDDGEKDYKDLNEEERRAIDDWHEGTL